MGNLKKFRLQNINSSILSDVKRFTENRLFGRHFPKYRPSWMKFGKHLLLHAIHLWVQFDPNRCMGGSRPNVIRTSFL